jgi:hypothetical protein
MVSVRNMDIFIIDFNNLLLGYTAYFNDCFNDIFVAMKIHPPFGVYWSQV